MALKYYSGESESIQLFPTTSEAPFTEKDREMPLKGLEGWLMDNFTHIKTYGSRIHTD